MTDGRAIRGVLLVPAWVLFFMSQTVGVQTLSVEKGVPYYSNEMITLCHQQDICT